MAVEVRLPNILRPHAGGQATVKAEGETIGQILEALVSEYPGMAGQLVTETGEMHRFVNVYVNDEDVRFLGSLDAKLADGDSVTILPAVAGG